jgi:hypothetical protein
MKVDKSQSRLLTKSLFKLADTCPAKLYYVGNQDYPSTNEENEFLQALAQGGYQVGALARCYYPEGVEVSTKDNDRAVQETATLLQQENVTIFEGAVSHDPFFLRADILKKEGKYLQLIEVKSKSFHEKEDSFVTKSGKISATWQPYINDVAFQTGILREAFPDLKVLPHLMLVDKSSHTSVDGLNQKFMIKNVSGKPVVIVGDDTTEEALGNRVLCAIDVSNYVDMVLDGVDSETGPLLMRAREYAKINRTSEPYTAQLSLECKNCEYRVSLDKLEAGQKSGFRECWGREMGGEDALDKPLAIEVWNFPGAKACLEKGIYLMDDIPVEELLMKKNKSGELSYKSPSAERQDLQIRKACREVDGKEVVDDALFSEMENWNFPLNFIDFETCMVAIPFNKKRRPYELIAFQFSCHSLGEDGTILHNEWVQTKPGEFPNFEFLVALKRVLENDEGTIFRYAPHENTVLRQIRDQLVLAVSEESERLPENPNALLKWIDSVTQWKGSVVEGEKVKTVTQAGYRNMVDMLELVRKYYYHPRMEGSNSMKAVLPAVMEGSEFLKAKYSSPYSGSNYEDMIWWREGENGAPLDPYKQLPPIFDDVDISKDELLLGSGHIAEGGAAMLAYSKTQYTEMTAEERSAITNGLLKYCELDTLAMLMLYEHWANLKGM